MSFTCAICEQEFADIPDRAVELARRRRGRRSYLYRFSNGALHDLRVVAGPKPPIMAKTEPPVEQIQGVQPEKLPETIVEKVEIEPEKPATAIALAFRRSKILKAVTTAKEIV